MHSKVWNQFQSQGEVVGSGQLAEKNHNLTSLSLLPTAHCLLPTAFPSEAVDEVEHDDGDERDDDGER